MLPQNIKSIDLNISEETSNTYNLKIDENRVFGFTGDNNLEAMKQAIYKIINTERYENLIYSFNYGVELADLFGQPKEYVLPEIKRRLTEGLMQDNRILSVDNFLFSNTSKNTISCTFTVSTIFGTVEAEKEVAA